MVATAEKTSYIKTSIILFLNSVIATIGLSLNDLLDTTYKVLLIIALVATTTVAIIRALRESKDKKIEREIKLLQKEQEEQKLARYIEESKKKNEK